MSYSRVGRGGDNSDFYSISCLLPVKLIIGPYFEGRISSDSPSVCVRLDRASRPRFKHSPNTILRSGKRVETSPEIPPSQARHFGLSSRLLDEA